MCNENRFLGGQAHASTGRHRAEQTTRGSANANENAQKREAGESGPGSVWVPSLLPMTWILMYTENQFY